MSPVPEETALPSGWLCEQICEHELVLRHERSGFEMIARRTDDSDRSPHELTAGWDLACRLRAGESVSERSIGRVSTRSAAVDGLRSCMARVSRLVRAGEVCSLAGTVRDIQRETGLRTVPRDAAP